MAITRIQMNWKDVSFGMVDFDKVTGVSIGQGGKVITSSADNDRYATVAVNPMAMPTMSITTQNTALAMGVAPGTQGTATATHIDAKEATGGDIVYVLDPAVANNAETSGQHGAFGTASLELIGISADGQTNPLSFTRV